MREYRIGENEAGQRFDKYLKKLLRCAPGGFLYKMLRKKNIVLNGKKASGSERLSVGDTVKLYLSEETFGKFSAAGRPLGLPGETGGKDVVASRGAGPTDVEHGGTLREAAGRPDVAHTGSGRRFPDEIGEFANDIGGIQEEPLGLPGRVRGIQEGFSPLEVVYEDRDILIIYKPAGMLSQKAAPADVSANEYILAYLLKKGEIAEEELATFRPAVCNRLDRNTPGLLAAGKTLKGLQELSEAFRCRSVKKYYRCIVRGEVREAARVKGWLGKDCDTNRVQFFSEKPDAAAQGNLKVREIEMEYRPLAVKGGFSELEVLLLTGRSHQIRAHLAAISHPILGDFKYGDRRLNMRLKEKLGISSQLLCACRLEFADGRVAEVPCGEEFRKAWDYVTGARDQ